jgi:hypothetical protein
MKRGNALQYALMITGIVMGYDAFQTLVTALWSLGNWLYDGGTGSSPYFPRISDYLFLLMQSVSCWWLIIRSGNIAVYISERTNMLGSFSISIHTVSLLKILITVMGLYFLLVSIPHVLNDALTGFGPGSDYVTQGVFIRSSRFVSIIQLILAGVLTACAGQLANFFAGKMQDEPITIAQQIEDIHADNNDTVK